MKIRLFLQCLWHATTNAMFQVFFLFEPIFDEIKMRLFFRCLLHKMLVEEIFVTYNQLNLQMISKRFYKEEQAIGNHYVMRLRKCNIILFQFKVTVVAC